MQIREVTRAGVVTRDATAEERAAIAAREAEWLDGAVARQRKVKSLSQFEMAQALKAAGILTHAQVMEWAQGTIPAPLAAYIALIPDAADREEAEMATTLGISFQRASPLWAAVAAHENGPTEAEIDAIFGIGT